MICLDWNRDRILQFVESFSDSRFVLQFDELCFAWFVDLRTLFLQEGNSPCKGPRLHPGPDGPIAPAPARTRPIGNRRFPHSSARNSISWHKIQDSNCITISWFYSRDSLSSRQLQFIEATPGTQESTKDPSTMVTCWPSLFTRLITNAL